MEIQTAKTKTKKIVFFILFGLGLVHLGMGLLNHYLFRTYTFDYATYNFAFFDYAHLRISACPIYPSADSGSFFQDHFSLTLFVFLPFYWLLTWLTGTYTLLIVQWAFVMYGAWATYKFIELKSDYRLAVLSMIYYFVLLGRFNACTADVNFAIIGGAMMPAFLYWFEKKNIPLTIICFLFMIINREDFSIWLIFVCIFLMAVHRREAFKLRLSIGLLLASIAALLLIFMVVIPAIEDEHKQYTLFNFLALGKTPKEALHFIFSHPLRTLELLFVNHNESNYYNDVKKEFYIVYLISGAFILIFRPLYFIPLLPLIAKKMYNDYPVRWSVETYYSVEFVSILPILIFWILAKMKREKLRLVISATICISALWISIINITTPDQEHIAVMSNTKKVNFLNTAFYKTTTDINALRKAMELIPADAAVCSSGGLASHLAFREKIYFFPRIDDADYVFALKNGDNWPITQEDYTARLKELVTVGKWKTLVDHPQFVLLARH